MKYISLIIVFVLMLIFTALVISSNKNVEVQQPTYNKLAIKQLELERKLKQLELERKLNDIAFVMVCEDGLSERGLRLVKSVIYNRTQSKNINALHKTITKKHQFECWTNRDILKPKILKNDNGRIEIALNILRTFINGNDKPITIAKYFYNYKILKEPPYWAKNMTVVFKDDNHVYLI